MTMASIKPGCLRTCLVSSGEHAGWLLDALREAAVSGEAVLGRADRHGQRYVIDFDLAGPTGRAMVRSA